MKVAAGIIKHLPTRPDSEFEQALIRVVIVASVWVTVYVAAHLGWLEEESERYLWYCAMYLGLALLLLAVIIRHPIKSPTRRIIGITADMVMLSLSTVLVGSSGLMFYPIFLWVTIGNGLRYGQRYLGLATLGSVIGFGIAAIYGNPLLGPPLVIGGLMVGLIALPVFFSMLLGRLNRAMADLNNLYARMTLLATRDSLTDLPNRELFFEHLHQAIALSRRRSTTFAVLFIDVDGFKFINDTQGHAAGDRVLQEIAIALTRAVRASDTVARLGGDEFVILLNDIVVNNAGLVAEKILEALTEIDITNGPSGVLTASIGIATFPDGGEDAESLMGHADLAMYEAKKAGKNSYREYRHPSREPHEGY